MHINPSNQNQIIFHFKLKVLKVQFLLNGSESMSTTREENMFIANFLCIYHNGIALRIKMNDRYSLTCFPLYLKEVLLGCDEYNVIVDDGQIPVLTHLYIEYNSPLKMY